jgi:soluble lytic murein transglycosylase-like protein
MAEDIDRHLDEAADRHGVPRERLRAMAHVESRRKPGAVSPKGARGVLQIMPDTARELGYSPEDMADPAKNADAGARYVRKMYERFKDWDTAVEAYNAGPARVAHRKAKGIPLPRETRRHVRRVKAAEAAEALAAKERKQ